MLYGNFREASSSSIALEYDGIILEAIVEFCCSNEISKFRVLYIQRHAYSARRLVQLAKAADYLQLEGLTKLVIGLAHNLTTRYPPLACAVYDEANFNTPLSQDALLMIQCRPYVTLPPDDATGGGIDCLSGTKLQTIFIDKYVKAGELFLFEMLQEWSERCCIFKSNEDTGEMDEHGYEENTNNRGTVQECASHIHLEDIEPQDLLSIVKPSGFCSDVSIVDAITKQALRASQNHIWSLSCRGRPNNIERILVEGAGLQDANGIYYFIDGLANGDLYSKREIACGQQYVYTLSISSVPGKDETECRIFCSKLLTNQAINVLSSRNTNNNRRPNNDASFCQPVLQIIDIEKPIDDEDKYTKLQLSDGDHFLRGKIRTSVRSKDLEQNTLIKVLKYSKYEYSDNGDIAIHLKKISIVNQDPGHKFGNPVYYYDIFDVEPPSSSLQEVTEDAVVVIDTTAVAPIEVELSQELHHLQRQRSMPEEEREKKDDDGTLLEMYSCRFAANQKPIHSKIPSVGWKVDYHGSAPVPKTRWIPAGGKGTITSSQDTLNPSL
mmetsp:Transcript_12999/g.14875  ORF Transcript_12999/g.14875 Transcript_12999/m.14875 type:complete len:552 (+) Transcript_12999:152-1807(+)